MNVRSFGVTPLLRMSFTCVGTIRWLARRQKKSSQAAPLAPAGTLCRGFRSQPPRAQGRCTSSHPETLHWPSCAQKSAPRRVSALSTSTSLHAVAHLFRLLRQDTLEEPVRLVTPRAQVQQHVVRVVWHSDFLDRQESGDGGVCQRTLRQAKHDTGSRTIVLARWKAARAVSTSAV